MKVFFKQTLFMVLMVFAVLLGNAQQTAESFVLETKYLLYLPDGYATDTSQKWPLLIFLHGSGESGTELDKVKEHGPPKLIGQGKKFPFIIVSPQAPPQTGWRVEVLKSMLDDLKKKYRVDRDRIYLTGLSMGGYGTWNFSIKYPDEFAAIAPICGGGDANEVWKLRHMPVWCFHGAKDDVVLPSESQKMIDGLKKYNANVKFTLYPDANHNSWDTTYSNDNLYTWLLSQKKYRHQAIDIKAQALKQYEGIYVNDARKDTIRMVIESEKLVAKPGRESYPLNASARDIFFWDENSSGELTFTRDPKGVVKDFLLLTNQQDRFRKLATKKQPSK